MIRAIRIVLRFGLARLPLIAFPRVNVVLNRLLGYALANSVRIYSSAQILGQIEVSIGPETFVGHEVLITGGQASIRIGSHCDISDRVTIVCGTHEIDRSGVRVAGKGIGKDVTIGSGVWIGLGALILPGVTIGSHSIIAAGTVVNKDVPPRTMVGGNPMRVLKALE